MSLNKLKKAIVVLLSSMVIVSVVGCSSLSSKNAKVLESPVFKNMQTTDINGNKVNSSDFSKNKLTLVNVWNTGCTPCVDEIPILDKLNTEYKDKGVSIKGLLLESEAGLTDQQKSTAKEIINKSKSTYQQLTASKELFESDVFKDIDSFPTTFFVDKNGNIVDVISGSNDYEGWKSQIEDVLKKVDSNE